MEARILQVVSVAVGVTASAWILAEDLELRSLDIAGWDCINRPEGTATTPDAKQRNRMKNRSPVGLSGLTIKSLDTPAFLEKVGEFDAQTTGKRRSELNASQRQQLESLEKQIVSLTGWLVLSYPGLAETANCGDDNYHDWHLEIFQNVSDHAPQIGDPTPIICEITPRTERLLYKDGVRIQSLTGYFRRQDMSFQSAGHHPKKIRVTGFLMWDDDHNGPTDVGKTVQWFSSDGYHHPWRSTAWEIHPAMRIEVAE